MLKSPFIASPKYSLFPPNPLSYVLTNLESSQYFILPNFHFAIFCFSSLQSLKQPVSYPTTSQSFQSFSLLRYHSPNLLNFFILPLSHSLFIILSIPNHLNWSSYQALFVPLGHPIILYRSQSLILPIIYFPNLSSFESPIHTFYFPFLLYLLLSSTSTY